MKFLNPYLQRAANIRTCFVVALILALAVQGRAQTATATLSWKQLQGYEFQNFGASASGSTVTATGAEALPVDQLFAHVSDLAAFISAHPGDSRVSEATRLEALMLVEAEVYGNFTQAAQCAALVAQVSADTSLSETSRCSLALLANSMSLQYQGYTSATAAGLLQMEKSLRAIITEFPNSPAVYAELLSFAKCAPEAQALKIVKDLSVLKAPAAVVANAQLMLNRFNLEGQQLSSILGANLSVGQVPSLAAGHLTILYAWTYGNPGCAYTAGQIKQLAPAGANVIGVNVDTDVASAQAFAQNMPGVQLYDQKGLGSLLAKALYLDLDNTVILVGRAGTIVSVTGARGIEAKLASANQ
jgi:hypothetical protein